MSTQDEVTLYDFKNKRENYDNKARHLFRERNKISEWFQTHNGIEVTEDKFTIYGLKFINEYFCSKDFRTISIRTSHLTEDHNGNISSALVNETALIEETSIVYHLIAVIRFSDDFQGLYPLIPKPPVSQLSTRI